MPFEIGIRLPLHDGRVNFDVGLWDTASLVLLLFYGCSDYLQVTRFDPTSS